MSEAIKEAEKILKQYYGYDHFREGQIPVIKAVLGGRDVLGIMPTGAGKSVCYQVPDAHVLTLDVTRDLAADLAYERSGGNAEPDGSPCRFLK